MKFKTLYLMDADAYATAFGPKETNELARMAEFVSGPHTARSLATAGAELAQVQAIFSGWGVPPMNTEFLARFPSLKIVFHSAGSVKSFVTDQLWQRGIRVTCAARINAIPVAEFTLSQVIFCLKHGWQRVREIREGKRFRKEDEYTYGCSGTTVGILSFGHTGRLVAEQLRILDVRIVGYDPFLSAAEATALGIELLPLDEVFAQSDVVTCHTPHLPETTGLLGAAQFARMKSGATFINTARGALVRETELCDVLQQRTDLFALLDVTDPEPPAPGSPLLSLPNVIITPHIAGSLGLECRRMGRMMIQDFHRYLRSEPLEGEVFPSQLPSLA